MRIAVCRPQVPFAYGGAEIFTDRLVDELRRRGHDADVVSVPFKWYPGARVLTQAFLWRMLDLEESDGQRIDLVSATKFPSYLVRHPEKRVWLVHQFRQAYELDGTDLGQFGDSAEERATRRKVQALDRVALGEASRLFAISQNVANRVEASTGLTAEVLPHPPQALEYRCENYGDFVLSVNRLDRAKRIDLLIEAAARDGSLEIVIAGEGPDRQRLEGLAHDRGLNGRARFTGRIPDAELADLYARCLAVYYAPVDEDYGMVPLEAFLSEKPVLTTTDAGRAARDRVRREHRARRDARRRQRSHARSAGSATTATKPPRTDERGRRSRARSPGTAPSRGCSREGRLLQPDAAGAVGHRRLQRAAPSGAPRADRRHRRASGEEAAPRGTDVALYHVGNNPDAHAWIVDALRKRPGVVVLHDFVLHHLVAGMTVGRRDGHAYLDLMEREHGVVGRLLGHGVLDKRIPPLWESRPADFPLADLRARARDRRSSSIRTTCATTRAPPGFGGPIGVVPHPAWPAPGVAPERVADGTVVGCFGVVNSSKRIPELLRATAAFGRSIPSSRSSWSGRLHPASTSTAVFSGSASTTPRSSARAGSTSRVCGR